MLSRAAKLTWLIIGILSLGLGALGILLPLLPTTPLVLLAAFSFARSSDRLHQWLLEHDVFGALIDNWRRYGAISRRAKVVSVVSMAVILGISLVAASEDLSTALAAASYGANDTLLTYVDGSLQIAAAAPTRVKSVRLRGDNGLDASRYTIGGTEIIEPLESALRGYELDVTLDLGGTSDYQSVRDMDELERVAHQVD